MTRNQVKPMIRIDGLVARQDDGGSGSVMERRFEAAARMDHENPSGKEKNKKKGKIVKVDKSTATALIVGPAAAFNVHY